MPLQSIVLVIFMFGCIHAFGFPTPSQGERADMTGKCKQYFQSGYIYVPCPNKTENANHSNTTSTVKDEMGKNETKSMHVPTNANWFEYNWFECDWFECNRQYQVYIFA